ncbi:MAG: Fur family transcriptional regulator [Thermoprotei archaeon]
MNSEASVYEDAKIIETLRGNGYRVTPQRLTVAKAVLNGRGHTSAEELYNRVKRLSPTISLATVYESLEALERSGLVTSFIVEPGKKVYDADTRPHINLVCRICGEITDVAMEPKDLQAVSTLSQVSEFSDVKISVTGHGVCPKHRKR